jgi:hypothetical protein
MLGLDAKTLSVPDYEITARLERLLTVVQPTMSTPVIQMPSSTIKSNNISQQQQHHYHNHHSAHGRRRSPSPVSRRTEPSHRARSLSPFHVGIDPRTY